jgi:hypothetical protein
MLSLLVGSAIVVPAETAAACGSLPYAFVEDVQPADGAAGVPRNTELRIRFFGAVDAAPLECSTNLTRLRLTPEGGSPRELDGELRAWPGRAEGWLVVKPPEPLLPETKYELELHAVRDDACAFEGDWTRLSSFETDSASDVRAPRLTGSPQLSYGDRETGTTNCGTTDGVPVVTVLGLDDDFQGARYNVYVDGELAGPYRDGVTASGEGAEIYVNCGTTALSTAIQVAPGARIEIRAVDIAGNESAPGEALSVPDKCRPSSDSSTDSGCSLTRVRALSWSDALWPLALFAGVARRSRRSRQQA